ncbi:MAG: hypothetical protein WBE76_18640, partial [Terracidiphilus sp.]
MANPGKPISLYPMEYSEAVSALLKVTPEPKGKTIDGGKNESVQDTAATATVVTLEPSGKRAIDGGTKA